MAKRCKPFFAGSCKRLTSGGVILISSFRQSLRCFCIFALGISPLYSIGGTVGVFGDFISEHFPKDAKIRQMEERDFDTPEALSKFTAIAFMSGGDCKQLNALRHYVGNGGVLFTQTPLRRDLSGASWTGYSAGSCFSMKAEKAHALTKGLDLDKWQDMAHPVNKLLKMGACSHIFQPEEESCEVLMSAKLIPVQEDGRMGAGFYGPAGTPVEGAWLVAHPYGRGLVVSGLFGAARYAHQLRDHSASEPLIDKLLSNLTVFLLEGCHKNIMETEAVSAKLCLEVDGLKGRNPCSGEIYINGTLAGYVPEWAGGWSPALEIPIRESAFSKLATKNTIQIKNNSTTPFKIRNSYIELSTRKGGKVKSTAGGEALYGPPQAKNDVSVFHLLLPVNELGFISQPDIGSGAANADARRGYREWPGLAGAALSSDAAKKRTSCWMLRHEFMAWPKETVKAKLDSFNAYDFSIEGIPGEDDKEFQARVDWLRGQGYRCTLPFSPIPSSSWLPGSVGHAKFFKKVAFWAGKVDVLMVDEWYFSPAILKTEGSSAMSVSQEFKDAFAKAYGLSDDDAEWAFKNSSVNDSRTLKLWEFCSKTGNDFMREFVRTAKLANPKVKTEISYITHNWNKLVSGLDSCIDDFDEILDCQTYWYGRYSSDPLDAPKITNAIGLGKILQYEYPDKFSWLGFDPGAAGAPPAKKEGGRLWRHLSTYQNTPEEMVPYLATLYASGSGVFIFTVFNGNGPGYGADDDFADVTRLVSKLVPHVKNHVKGDVAYCYDTEASWPATRSQAASRGYAMKEGDISALGYVQQFLDVDLVKRPGSYQKIISAGTTIPQIALEGRDAYFMYAPLYGANGEALEPGALKEKGIAGTKWIESGYYRIGGDVAVESAMLYGSYFIDPIDILLPSRHATGPDGKSKAFCIGAKSKDGKVRMNSLAPFSTSQSVMRAAMGEDFRSLGWAKRDCPQINGRDHVVAVAFRDPRKAVVDFGGDALPSLVKIVIFNGRDGVVRNEIVEYRRGMEVELAPLNVLVASSLK